MEAPLETTPIIPEREVTPLWVPIATTIVTVGLLGIFIWLGLPEHSQLIQIVLFLSIEVFMLSVMAAGSIFLWFHWCYLRFNPLKDYGMANLSKV